MVYNFAGDLHGHGRTADVNLLDGLDEFGWRHIFEEVTARATSQCIEDQIALFVGGEHEDLKLGKPGFETGDAFDAAHAWEIDVHEHDIRDFRRNRAESRFGVGVSADATEVGGAAKQLGKAFASAATVFND